MRKWFRKNGRSKKEARGEKRKKSLFLKTGQVRGCDVREGGLAPVSGENDTPQKRKQQAPKQGINDLSTEKCSLNPKSNGGSLKEHGTSADSRGGAEVKQEKEENQADKDLPQKNLVLVKNSGGKGM